MAESKLHTVELTDDELEGVQGGYIICSRDGKYYTYTGSDPDQKYVCPNCGRPVHEGTGWRFYCDACDESWFFERCLAPNLSSGAWTEISEEEYVRPWLIKGLGNRQGNA